MSRVRLVIVLLVSSLGCPAPTGENGETLADSTSGSSSIEASTGSDASEESSSSSSESTGDAGDGDASNGCPAPRFEDSQPYPPGYIAPYDDCVMPIECPELVIIRDYDYNSGLPEPVVQYTYQNPEARDCILAGLDARIPGRYSYFFIDNTTYQSSGRVFQLYYDGSLDVVRGWSGSPGSNKFEAASFLEGYVFAECTHPDYQFGKCVTDGLGECEGWGSTEARCTPP